MKIALSVIMLMVLCGGDIKAGAQVRQEPPPTAPQIDLIAPGLRDLKDVTPWELLAQTLFTRKKFHDDEYDMDYFVEMPEFPPAVAVLEGKQVTIKGYTIAFDAAAEHQVFLVTGIPANGEDEYDGPGSLVVEVHAAQPLEIKNGVAAYTGIFETVPGDVKAHGIYYRLKDASPVTE